MGEVERFPNSLKFENSANNYKWEYDRLLDFKFALMEKLEEVTKELKELDAKANPDAVKLEERTLVKQEVETKGWNKFQEALAFYKLTEQQYNEIKKAYSNHVNRKHENLILSSITVSTFKAGLIIDYVERMRLNKL